MKALRFLIIIVCTAMGFEGVRQHFTELKEGVLVRTAVFFAIAAALGAYTIIKNKKGSD